MKLEDKKYEKNKYMPLINIIPGIIWSIPVCQYVFPNVTGAASLVIGAIVTTIYVILSYKPFVAAIPAILGVIIMTGMLWSLADGMEDMEWKIAIKVLILVVVCFAEFGIFSNATVPWLEEKEEERRMYRW